MGREPHTLAHVRGETSIRPQKRELTFFSLQQKSFFVCVHTSLVKQSMFAAHPIFFSAQHHCFFAYDHTSRVRQSNASSAAHPICFLSQHHLACAGAQLTSPSVAVAVHGYVIVQPVVSGANLQYVSASTPLWQARHRRVLSVQPPQMPVVVAALHAFVIMVAYVSIIAAAAVLQAASEKHVLAIDLIAVHFSAAVPVFWPSRVAQAVAAVMSHVEPVFVPVPAPAAAAASHLVLAASGVAPAAVATFMHFCIGERFVSAPSVVAPLPHVAVQPAGSEAFIAATAGLKLALSQQSAG